MVLDDLADVRSAVDSYYFLKYRASALLYTQKLNDIAVNIYYYEAILLAETFLLKYGKNLSAISKIANNPQHILRLFVAENDELLRSLI